jgi:hypothetical protein
MGLAAEDEEVTGSVQGSGLMFKIQSPKFKVKRRWWLVAGEWSDEG